MGWVVGLRFVLLSRPIRFSLSFVFRVFFSLARSLVVRRNLRPAEAEVLASLPTTNLPRGVAVLGSREKRVYRFFKVFFICFIVFGRCPSHHHGDIPGLVNGVAWLGWPGLAGSVGRSLAWDLFSSGELGLSSLWLFFLLFASRFCFVLIF